MIKTEYANAYKEVLEILKYVSKEDFNKIPRKKIEMFSKYANYDYNFEYDPAITLKEQNVSDIAQTIIAIIFRDYWATEKQREKIINKEKHDLQLIEEEKKSKYDIDVFKNNNNNIKDNKLELVKYKESLIKKIFNKIKEFFI